MSNKKNISASYPLSPMQQGMLFHSLYAPESEVYCEQMSIDLTGDINIAAFEAAWQKVVDRYSILRTLFVWENRTIPLQVVLKDVTLPWQNLDWSHLSSEEQEQQLSDFLDREREQGFAFDQPPLMRCTLIKLSDETYKFIWSFHHILIEQRKCFWEEEGFHLNLRYANTRRADMHYCMMKCNSFGKFLHKAARISFNYTFQREHNNFVTSITFYSPRNFQFFPIFHANDNDHYCIKKR